MLHIFKRLIRHRPFLTLVLILFSVTMSIAQSALDLRQIKADELPDSQLRTFGQEILRRRIGGEQLDMYARQQGIAEQEWIKMKDRLEKMGFVFSNTQLPTSQGRTMVDSTAIANNRPATGGSPFEALVLANFGQSIFTDAMINFDAPMNIPTPADYLLAAGDELVVDVSGNSEAQYKLVVSPEGLIRIPVAGPVNVNGLTIEKATKKIVQRLANTIYSSVKTGKTIVDVSLGRIRTIKVLVIGEAVSPGSYSLPSLATLFHALHSAGGPNANGSYRDIQLIRKNKTISELDIYQFILTGNRSGDIRLQDGDIVKINTYGTRISLQGEIKHPAKFDLKPGEDFSKLLEFAGGFTENAYTGRIRVTENDGIQRKIATYDLSGLRSSIPRSGNVYTVGSILNKFLNRVSIQGAVSRPGEYELKDKMRLSDLIEEAAGLREDAYLVRGIIHRLADDLTPTILSFSYEDSTVLHPSTIELKKEDRVQIYSKFALLENYSVTISGEVKYPSTFPFEEQMRIQDLLLLAGGLKEAGTLHRLEISRRVKDSLVIDPSLQKTSQVYQFDLSSPDSSNAGMFQLEPFDQVFVRSSPGYFTQKNAVIEGEVLYGGKYSLETKRDRISDLLKRSGGLTSDAYLKGAVLVRTRNLSPTELKNMEIGARNLVKQNLNAGGSLPYAELQYKDLVQTRSDFVNIDLAKIIESPASQYDLFLEEGDTVRIPRQLQTVRVNGEVLYPTLVRFDERLSFKKYIFQAGGFSDRAAPKRSYIVHPNGSAEATRHFLFFKNYPTVKPGSEIYIPLKREKERLRTGEVIAIGATLVSMLAIVFSILR